MNSIALNYAFAILAVILSSVVLALALRTDQLDRLKSVVAWLLKAAYLDFVEMVIFIRPWKPYVQQIGILIWLILIFAVGRYMIVVQPELTEIPGPFIPAIGYVYFVSILVIMRSVLRVMRKDA